MGWLAAFILIFLVCGPQLGTFVTMFIVAYKLGQLSVKEEQP